MKGSLANPKVFISYSWTTTQHEQWVLSLAERLSGDGIIVVLDKWDLKEGNDKHVFMEQMVQDTSIQKVLVICDKRYQEKADERKGGVGTETQLISKKVYESTEQEKFIPIVREYDNGKPCVPHYMGGRVYIDLSSEATFEENYEKLIRNLYGKPTNRKPVLGTPPAYISEDEPIVLKTSHKVNEIKSALLNDRRSANGQIADYLETFLVALGDFRLAGGQAPDFDEKVLASIEKMTALRDDFIDFIYTIFKYQEKVDLDMLHNFFEKVLIFISPPEGVPSTEVDCDNYKFFLYELILNFITILFQLKRYNEAAFFINSEYFYQKPPYGLRHDDIEVFNHHMRSIDEIRNQRLGLNRTCITADLIKARSNRKDISFGEIIETDLILHYLRELDGKWWFPRTAVYKTYNAGVDFFGRLISVQYFGKMKVLFGVETIGQLKDKIAAYLKAKAERGSGNSRSWGYDLDPLERVIDPAKLGTVK